MRGAGGGRPSKPDDQKRNRMPPTKDTIVINAGDRVTSIPDPAFPLEGVRRQVWDAMWSRPVAVLWDEADVASLTRMVVLQTSREALADRGVLAEIRQLEDRFLLNPYARAQQRVVIEGDDAEEVPADVDDLAEYRARLAARLPG